MQLSQALEIFVMIGIDRTMSGFPGGICDWALRDYAHFLFAGQRQREIDRFLVADVD